MLTHSSADKYLFARDFQIAVELRKAFTRPNRQRHGILCQRMNKLVVDHVRGLHIAGQGDEVRVGARLKIARHVCRFASIQRFEGTK